jgi:hypothetical protein
MPTDFSAIAKRALEQGHVDEPRASDLEELEVAKMSDLRQRLNDICADSIDLDVGTILYVLATFFGESIVNHTENAGEAVKVFKDITGVISDAVYLCLQKKREMK